MEGLPLVGVRLRATVCFDTAREAIETYPTSVGITHFAINRKTNAWWPARAVVDRAPWLVPFGETWKGHRCGPTWAEDPIPATHYGVESLGNPLSCYAVELALTVGKVRATRRAILGCHGLPTPKPR